MTFRGGDEAEWPMFLILGAFVIEPAPNPLCPHFLYFLAIHLLKGPNAWLEHEFASKDLNSALQVAPLRTSYEYLP